MNNRIDLGFSGATFMLDEDISQLEAECLYSTGIPKVVSADIYKEYTANQIRVFCLKHGLYSLPTTELIDWLTGRIDGRKTIEVGAGNGTMSNVLDIQATDSYQQRFPKYKKQYAEIHQPTVTYGNNVLQLEALKAVKRFKPEVVIGAWVTHKWSHKRPEAGGNEIGLEEKRILHRVKEYIVIGNEEVHKRKPLLEYPHVTLKPDWLVSRANDQSLNCIYIWTR